MKSPLFDDPPTRFPAAQVNGSPLKSITHLLLERRATAHFKPDPVPQEYLEAILRFAAQAPSGYNLQPWRFIVVREAENRRRLQKAAMNQSKVGEAPVVVIAYAIKGQWKAHMDAIFRDGVQRGTGKADQLESAKKSATSFIETLPEPLWLNRHVMICVTTMMLVAEAYGLDTAPMEGFDAAAVKREFGLPPEAEVVALLAIGLGSEPDKTYGGRFALSEIVAVEHFGQPWPGSVVA